ncbi:hypothetical protein TIFTF001_055019 [Ficus carica]|uniref:Uncharacterized protein n=1 Tax=Ficus carica TaxID=3494 RepID=A0AA88EJA7_FICCA|nr:hypothetical protein TIFTF001_055019 [Ficus carica]
MEAMMGDMKRVMSLELEQIHEQKKWMENTRVDQPQPTPNVRLDKNSRGFLRVNYEDLSDILLCANKTIMSHNSIIDGGTDPKLFVEAMMGEMKRVMRLELEQIHE